jgi:hypothetical protein
VVSNKSLTAFGVTLRITPEDRGHLVPALLGGSQFQKIVPASDNFISQDVGINRGGYNKFGQKVNERFKEYIDAYEAECAERSNFREEHRFRIFGVSNPFCDCHFPYPQNPSQPTLTYRVHLVMALPNTNYLESQFSDRPEKIEVSVVFNRNSAYDFSNAYKALPIFATISVEFTNYIDFEGANPYNLQKRNNYYRVTQNDARVNF